MILAEGIRTKAYDMIKVLLIEKHITLNNDYTVILFKNLFEH